MYKVVINSCYGGFGLSDKAEAWFKEHNYDLSTDVDSIYYNRHHPLLVQCVEELGEDASGDFAQLIVKEISSNRYIIDDYDGYERIITPEIQKWIVINN